MNSEIMIFLADRSSHLPATQVRSPHTSLFPIIRLHQNVMSPRVVSEQHRECQLSSCAQTEQSPHKDEQCLPTEASIPIREEGLLLHG